MPFMYGVRCHQGCGLRELTQEQHDAHMARPDDFWKCPTCGGSAEWDDNSFVTDPPDDTEGPPLMHSPEATAAEIIVLAAQLEAIGDSLFMAHARQVRAIARRLKELCT